MAVSNIQIYLHTVLLAIPIIGWVGFGFSVWRIERACKKFVKGLKGLKGIEGNAK